MASNSFIRFTISFWLPGEQKTDSLDFVLSKAAGSSSSRTLILEAALPENTSTASRLFISLVLDGSQVLPEIPAGGFVNLTELYNWLQANWYIYGRWFMTADKIVLYLNAGLAAKGTLSVSATSKYVFTAAIPQKELEAFYYVAFSKDGVDVLPAFPEDIAGTMEDIIVWANQNWQEVGQWHIEKDMLVLTADQPAEIKLSVTGRLPGGFDFGFSKGFDT